MRNRPITTCLCCCLAGFLPSLFPLQAIADDPPAPDKNAALPRYRLEIGRELVYQLTSSEKPSDAGGSSTDKDRARSRDQMEWRIVVAGKNEDGSWRLYIRTQVTLVNRDGAVRSKHDSFGYCDLHPNGAYSLDEQTAVFKKLFPYQLFCRLPGSAAAQQNGWKHEPPVLGRSISYRVAKRDGAHLHITGIQHDPYSHVNEWQTTYNYDFDTERGLVVSIVNDWLDLATKQVKSRQTVRLVSSADRDGAWIARFSADAERYLDRNGKWIALCYDAMRARTVDACQTVREKARALLVAGREQAQLDMVRELYDADIRTHDADENWMVDSVKKREKFFAAAPDFPADWQAMRFDGTTFRLADHRGKILVLYFWTTSCEYCVQMGPQIGRLAADNQGKHDVAVVGMFITTESVKAEESRARYFIAHSYPGFPHLEANDIPALYGLQQYGLEGYPSILILDPAGKVHEAFVGYAADLEQRIRKIIAELRGDPAKTR
jgi:thiol-disulfide isomerase/thioredoxin